MNVYLAGPISGLNYRGATDWRAYAYDTLKAVGITAYSPMRAKHYLVNIESFVADCDPYAVKSALSSNRGIMTRDHWDATRCDLVLVNLLGAKTVSIGTVMEIAWAWDHGRPVVCAIEPEGNVHEHGMLKEAIGFRVPTLEEAIAITKAVLLPDYKGDVGA